MITFGYIDQIEDPERGFIQWRYGTGANIELFQLKAKVPGKGNGRWLVTEMLRRVREQKLYPYHTIFGFCLPDNVAAQEFYKAMGFDLSPVKGVYAAGSAVVFSASFLVLCRMHLEKDDADPVRSG